MKIRHERPTYRDMHYSMYLNGEVVGSYAVNARSKSTNDGPEDQNEEAMAQKTEEIVDLILEEHDKVFGSIQEANAKKIEDF